MKHKILLFFLQWFCFIVTKFPYNKALSRIIDKTQKVIDDERNA